jgi:hypothetical protein
MNDVFLRIKSLLMILHHPVLNISKDGQENFIKGTKLKLGTQYNFANNFMTTKYKEEKDNVLLDFVFP